MAISTATCRENHERGGSHGGRRLRETPAIVERRSIAPLWGPQHVHRLVNFKHYPSELERVHGR